MKMSTAEIQETINRLNLTDKEKEKLQFECDRGNGNALFAVYGTWLRSKTNNKPIGK